MEQLPDNALACIFGFLWWRDLAAVDLVCRRWKDISRGWVPREKIRLRRSCPHPELIPRIPETFPRITELDVRAIPR